MPQLKLQAMYIFQLMHKYRPTITAIFQEVLELDRLQTPNMIFNVTQGH